MKLLCPHCHTHFQVDEGEYAAIIAQVKNSEFDAEISRRLNELAGKFRAEEKARTLEAEKAAADRMAESERRRLEMEMEIARLRAQIANSDALKQAALAEAETRKSLEISGISAEKDRKIAELNARIEKSEADHQLAIAIERNNSADELNRQRQTIIELNSRLQAQEVAAKNKVMELNERHVALLKAKDEEIEHYKDMKSRLSTKMLGETLEQHCANMFNRARSQGQFMNAYFDKDNDASRGTKGDFIFRDFIDGQEYISIMFEMKNQDEKTATKHRNEDFYAKLDRDRREKNCEYAVLVSMLEADSELFNEGIVDVSYRYPKMLVVRPQFFMAVIHLLANASRRGAEKLIAVSRDLELARAQSVDVTRFEKKRDEFVANFAKLVDAHISKQDSALAEIDKAIAAAEKQADNLRKIKTLFETSKQKLIRANESAENDFTIKKLTYGNPTMKAKFEEARRLNAESDPE